MTVSDKLKALRIDRTQTPPPRNGGKLAIGLVAGLVAGGAGMWVGLARSAPEPAPAPVAAPAQTTPEAEKARPRGGLVASGYVTARRAATVSVDITGRLTDVLFEEGAVVQQGQKLAQLDDRLARYDLQLAEARLESARRAIGALRAEKLAAEADRERADKLSRADAVSASVVEASVARLDSLTARIAAAEADIRTAELAVKRQGEFLARHQVRAPFSGVIIAKNAQAGEILSPAAGGGEFTRTGVATLVDMESLEVEVDVNEGQIADVRPGQSARIVLDAYTDWEIPGEVIAIIPTANRDRATIQVRVGFLVRDPRILPEMAAKVTFDRGAG